MGHCSATNPRFKYMIEQGVSNEEAIGYFSLIRDKRFREYVKKQLPNETVDKLSDSEYLKQAQAFTNTNSINILDVSRKSKSIFRDFKKSNHAIEVVTNAVLQLEKIFLTNPKFKGKRITRQTVIATIEKQLRKQVELLTAKMNTAEDKSIYESQIDFCTQLADELTKNGTFIDQCYNNKLLQTLSRIKTSKKIQAEDKADEAERGMNVSDFEMFGAEAAGTSNYNDDVPSQFSDTVSSKVMYKLATIPIIESVDKNEKGEYSFKKSDISGLKQYHKWFDVDNVLRLNVDMSSKRAFIDSIENTARKYREYAGLIQLSDALKSNSAEAANLLSLLYQNFSTKQVDKVQVKAVKKTDKSSISGKSITTNVRVVGNYNASVEGKLFNDITSAYNATIKQASIDINTKIAVLREIDITSDNEAKIAAALQEVNKSANRPVLDSAIESYIRDAVLTNTLKQAVDKVIREYETFAANAEEIITKMNDADKLFKKRYKAYIETINQGGKTEKPTKPSINDFATTKVGSTRSGFINLFKKYSVVKIEKNSPNVEGSMSSNYMKPSYWSELNSIFESKEKLHKWATEKAKLPNAKYFNFLFEQEYIINGKQVTTYGLLDKQGNLTPYATELFKVVVFDGIKAETGEGQTYKKMSNSDYASAMYDLYRREKQNDENSTAFEEQQATYIMPIPSDKPTQYAFDGVKYSVDAAGVSLVRIKGVDKIEDGLGFSIIPTPTTNDLPNLFEDANNSSDIRVDFLGSKTDNSDKIDTFKEEHHNKITALSGEYNNAILKIANQIEHTRANNTDVFLNVRDDNDNTTSVAKNRTEYRLEVKEAVFALIKELKQRGLIDKVTLHFVNDMEESKHKAKTQLVTWLLKNNFDGTIVKNEVRCIVHVDSKFKINRYSADNIIGTQTFDSSFSIDRNALLYKQMQNVLYNELAMMAQAIDTMFEHDNGNIKFKNGKPVLKEKYRNGTADLYKNYHFSGKIIDDNGQLTGNVFQFWTLENEHGELNNLANDKGVFAFDFLYGGLTKNKNNLSFTKNKKGQIELKLTKKQTDLLNNYLDRYIVEQSIDTHNKLAPILDNTQDRELSTVDALEYTLNYIINQDSINKMTWGDVRFAKNTRDILKRQAQFNANGMKYADLYTEPQSVKITDNKSIELRDKYKSVVVKGNVQYLKAGKIVYDKLIALGVNETVARETAEGYGYNNVSSTEVDDGESYITFDEFVRRMILSGNYEQYEDLIRGVYEGNIDAITLNGVVQAQKNFYYKLKYDERLGIDVPVQIKNAEVVLLPGLIKGTELELMNRYMIDNNIDQLNFDSTSKVATVKPISLFDKEGLFKTEIDVTESELENASSIFSYSNLYRQLEVPEHLKDEENKIGIQMKKKLFTNQKNTKLLDRFQEISEVNVKEDAKAFLKEFGIELKDVISDEDFEKIDPSEFYNIVRDELFRTNQDTSTVAATEIKIDRDGVKRMALSTSIPMIRRKISASIQSTYTNNITKQKIAGFHASQISNTGFKRNTITTDKGVTHKPLRWHESEDGFVSHVEVKLPMWSNDLAKLRKKLIKDGMSKVEAENEIIRQLEKQGLDTMIGYRSPTEGKQSIVIMKIVGFLDDTTGSTIMLPDAWITQSGADFDIDSVYGNYKTFKVTKNGEIKQHKLITSESTINERKQAYIDYVRREAGAELKKAIKQEKKINKDIIDRYDERFEKQSEELQKTIDKAYFENLKKYKEQHPDYFIKGDATSLTLTSKGKIEYNKWFNETIVTEIYNKIEAENKHNNLSTATQVAFLKTIMANASEEGSDLALNMAKLVADENKDTIMSYSAFLSLSDLEQSSREARDNELVNVFIEALSNVAGTIEGFQRSNFDDISVINNLLNSKLIEQDKKEKANSRATINDLKNPTNVGKEVNVSRNVDKIGVENNAEIKSTETKTRGTVKLKSFSKFVTPTTQIQLRDDAMGGAENKSVSVKDDHHIAICNITNTTLGKGATSTIVYTKDNFKYDKNGKQRSEDEQIKKLKAIEKYYPGSIYHYDDAGNIVSCEVHHYTYGNSPVKDEHGISYSVNEEILTCYCSQTTAQTLDAMKAGNLKNINSYTMDVFKYITAIGSDYYTAIGFMYQPAVSMIVKELDLNKSVHSKFNYNAENAVYKKLVEKLLGLSEGALKFKKSADIDKMIKEAEIKLEDLKLNGKELEDNITSDLTNKDAIIFQLRVLNEFKRLKNIGSRISNIAATTRTDKFGGGQSVRDVIKFIDKIKRSYSDTVLKIKGEPFVAAIYPISNLYEKFVEFEREDADPEVLEALLNEQRERSTISDIISYYNELDLENSHFKDISIYLKASVLPSAIISSKLIATESEDFIKSINVDPIIDTFNDTQYNAYLDYVIANVIKEKAYKENSFGSDGIFTSDYEGLTITLTTDKQRVLGTNSDLIKHVDIVDFSNPTTQEIEEFVKLSPANKIIMLKEYVSSTSNTILEHLNIVFKKDREFIYLNESGMDIAQIQDMFGELYENDNILCRIAALDLMQYALLAENFQYKASCVSKAIPMTILLNENDPNNCGLMYGLDEYIKDIDNVIDCNRVFKNFLRQRDDLSFIPTIKPKGKTGDKYRENASGIIAIRETVAKESKLLSDENELLYKYARLYNNITQQMELYSLSMGEITTKDSEEKDVVSICIYGTPMGRLNTGETDDISVNSRNAKGLPDISAELVQRLYAAKRNHTLNTWLATFNRGFNHLRISHGTTAEEFVNMGNCIDRGVSIIDENVEGVYVLYKGGEYKQEWNDKIVVIDGNNKNAIWHLNYLNNQKCNALLVTSIDTPTEVRNHFNKLKRENNSKATGEMLQEKLATIDNSKLTNDQKLRLDKIINAIDKGDVNLEVPFIRENADIERTLPIGKRTIYNTTNEKGETVALVLTNFGLNTTPLSRHVVNRKNKTANDIKQRLIKDMRDSFKNVKEDKTGVLKHSHLIKVETLNDVFDELLEFNDDDEFSASSNVLLDADLNKTINDAIENTVSDETRIISKDVTRQISKYKQLNILSDNEHSGELGMSGYNDLIRLSALELVNNRIIKKYKDLTKRIDAGWVVDGHILKLDNSNLYLKMSSNPALEQEVFKLIIDMMNLIDEVKQYTITDRYSNTDTASDDFSDDILKDINKTLDGIRNTSSLVSEWSNLIDKSITNFANIYVKDKSLDPLVKQGIKEILRVHADINAGSFYLGDVAETHIPLISIIVKIMNIRNTKSEYESKNRRERFKEKLKEYKEKGAEIKDVVKDGKFITIFNKSKWKEKDAEFNKNIKIANIKLKQVAKEYDSIREEFDKANYKQNGIEWSDEVKELMRINKERDDFFKDLARQINYKVDIIKSTNKYKELKKEVERTDSLYHSALYEYTKSKPFNEKDKYEKIFNDEKGKDLYDAYMLAVEKLNEFITPTHVNFLTSGVEDLTISNLKKEIDELVIKRKEKVKQTRDESEQAYYNAGITTYDKDVYFSNYMESKKKKEEKAELDRIYNEVKGRFDAISDKYHKSISYYQAIKKEYDNFLSDTIQRPISRNAEVINQNKKQSIERMIRQLESSRNRIKSIRNDIKRDIAALKGVFLDPNTEGEDKKEIEQRLILARRKLEIINNQIDGYDKDIDDYRTVIANIKPIKLDYYKAVKENEDDLKNNTTTEIYNRYIGLSYERSAILKRSANNEERATQDDIARLRYIKQELNHDALDEWAHVKKGIDTNADDFVADNEITKSIDAIKKYEQRKKELFSMFYENETQSDWNTIKKYNEELIELKEKSGKSLYELEADSEYQDALKWIRNNTYTELDEVFREDLKRAFEKLGTRKTSVEVNKILNGARDRDGVVNPALLSNIDKKQIRLDQSRKTQKGKAIDVKIIKNVASSTDEVYTDFYYHTLRKLSGKGVSQTPIGDLEKMSELANKINNILFKVYDKTTKKISFYNLSETDLLTLADLKEQYRELTGENKFKNSELKLFIKKTFNTQKFNIDHSKNITEFAKKTGYSQEAIDAFHSIISDEIVTKKGDIITIPAKMFFNSMILKPSARLDYLDRDKMNAAQFVKDNVQFRPTKYYWIELKRMNDELKNGNITKDVFDTWFNDNHIYNNINGEFEPLRYWTEMVITNNDVKSVEPTPKWVTPNLRPEVENGDYNPNIIKPSENVTISSNNAYRNSDYDSLTPDQIDLLDYLRTELDDVTKDDANKRFLNDDYIPAENKVDISSNRATAKEILKHTFGYNDQTSDKSEREKHFGDLTTGLSQMRMLSDIQLLKPETKETPEKQIAEIERVFNENKKLIEERNKQHAENINTNYEQVFEKYIHEANHYNNRKEIGRLVRISIEAAKKMGVMQTNRDGSMKLNARQTGITGDDTIVTKESERTVKELERHSKKIIYNTFEADAGRWNKIARVCKNYSSLRYMSFNFSGAISNIMFGSWAINTEKFAKEYIDEKAWMDARKEWFANAGDMFASAFNEHPSDNVSETVNLCRAFNIINILDVMGIDSNSTSLELAKKIHSASFCMQGIGEIYMHNTMLLAMLNTYRVFNDESGKPVIGSLADYQRNIRYNTFIELLQAKGAINFNSGSTESDEVKKFKDFVRSVSNDKQKAKDYVELNKDIISEYIRKEFGVNSDLANEFADKYKEAKKKSEKEFNLLSPIRNYVQYKNNSISVTHDSPVTFDDVMDFRNKVISIGHKMHGIYDKIGANRIQGTWWGGLVMQFHKHLVPGYAKRFGLQFGKGSFNETRGREEKGMYISLFQFLGTPIKQMKEIRETDEGKALGHLQTFMQASGEFISNFGAYYENLPDYEKANIRRTAGELLTVAAGILLAVGATLLIAGGEDPEKRRKKRERDMVDRMKMWCGHLLLMSADRLSSEAIQFNVGMVGETKKMGEKPVAFGSIMMDMYSVMATLTDYVLTQDIEKLYYQSGALKGENKITYKLIKNTPIITQAYKAWTLTKNGSYYKKQKNAQSYTTKPVTRLIDPDAIDDKPKHKGYHERHKNDKDED